MTVATLTRDAGGEAIRPEIAAIVPVTIGGTEAAATGETEVAEAVAVAAAAITAADRAGVAATADATVGVTREPGGAAAAAAPQGVKQRRAASSKARGQDAREVVAVVLHPLVQRTKRNKTTTVTRLSRIQGLTMMKLSISIGKGT